MPGTAYLYSRRLIPGEGSNVTNTLGAASALFFAIAATPALAQAPIIHDFGDWKISCEIDRMTDVPNCLTTIRLQQCNASVLLYDSGAVDVVASPRPTEVNIRIDNKNAFRCDGYPYCQFNDDSSIKLQAHIQNGSTIIGNIAGINSYCQFSQPIAGRYQQMLAIAREWGQHLPEPKTATR
jgi:hypothetical protein